MEYHVVWIDNQRAFVLISEYSLNIINRNQSITATGIYIHDTMLIAKGMIEPAFKTTSTITKSKITYIFNQKVY